MACTLTGMLSYCGSHRIALASTEREKQSDHQQDIQTLIEVKELQHLGCADGVVSIHIVTPPKF